MTATQIRKRIEIKNRRLGRCHSRHLREELHTELADLNARLAAALADESQVDNPCPLCGEECQTCSDGHFDITRCHCACA